jgi:hypothetical protein
MGIYASAFQDCGLALIGFFNHLEHVYLLSVDAGSALCLALVMSLCLHEIAVAVETYKQNRYEDFNHIDTTMRENSILQNVLM